MADFSTLKTQVPIETGITLLNLTMSPVEQKDPTKPPQWRGKCPACANSSNRDLVITQSKGFMCWAGKADANGRRPSGSIVDLVAHVRGIPLKSAGEWIEAEQKRTVRNVPAQRNDTAEPRNVQNSTPLAPLTYLEATHEAVQRLGIDPETAEHFGAGFAPRGILRGRLALPIVDRTGQLVAYTGRNVTDESPVLTFPKGFDPHAFLFNWERQVEGDTVFIVEDPLQVLLAYQNGVENVVSTLTDMTPDVVHMIGAWMDDAQIVYIRPM